MLYSTRPAVGMGVPSLPALPASRHFPQWSRTAILTITNGAEENDEVRGGFLILIYLDRFLVTYTTRGEPGILNLHNFILVRQESL